MSTLVAVSLEITVFYIRLSPEGRLQNHRLPPSVVHTVDDFRRVTFFCEIRLHRNDNRRAECEQVAGANVTERVTIVRLIFLGAMMA